MLRLAHITHPGIVPETSDLKIAQPITFETMKTARDFAVRTPGMKIELYAVQFHDEERIPLPDCFTRTPDLTRTICDIKTFKKKRKLALVKDILDILYAQAPTADYLVYTNVDIALMPYFYTAQAHFIETGYPAYAINRRTIPGHYKTIPEIPLMYAEIGQPHKGYDCFVFKRESYPHFKLGNICIGAAWIGRAMIANMIAYAQKFNEFRNEHLTFHIGDAQDWRTPGYDDYTQHNRAEYMEIFAQLEKEKGPYDNLWRSYLLDTGDKRQYPKFD